MKLQYLLVAYLIFFVFSSRVDASDPPPPILTSGDLKSIGAIESIPKGSYLRIVNYESNYDKWFHQVVLVDQDNNLLSREVLKVSQTYLLPDGSDVINKNLEFIDNTSGKTITGYPGLRYIITESKNSGWQTYTVQFVDEEGSLVNHKGIPVSTPHTYKITQKYLDADRTQTPLRKLNEVQNKVGSGKITEPIKCNPQVETKKVTATVDTSDLKDVKSSYEYLMKKRSELKALGYRGCMNTKEKIQDDFLKEHPYGKLSLSDRANKVLSDAKATLQNMKETSGSKNAKSSSSYKNFVNGHYIDPVVSPNVAACISFQETKGNLNPFAVNYTYCNSKMTSTAHGLGQMTLSTMEGMMENPDGDMVPLTSAHSKKYKGMTAKQIHSKMSGDVGMQLEILMRTLSGNAKYIRWRNKGLSEAEILKRAVIQYDQDSQSKYIKNVINNCLPCLNAGGSGSSCYKKVE